MATSKAKSCRAASGKTSSINRTSVQINPVKRGPPQKTFNLYHVVNGNTKKVNNDARGCNFYSFTYKQVDLGCVLSKKGQIQKLAKRGAGHKSISHTGIQLPDVYVFAYNFVNDSTQIFILLLYQDCFRNHKS